MTPTTKTELPNEAELLEIEQDLDTEDFLLEDLYELSGTEESEILADIDFEKSMTEIYMEEILGCDSWNTVHFLYTNDLKSFNIKE